MSEDRQTKGFASMDQERRREIARRGGLAAHAQGRAHRFTTDEARAAGKKGGDAVSQDRSHMAKIGRLGGMKSRRPAPAVAEPEPQKAS